MQITKSSYVLTLVLTGGLCLSIIACNCNSVKNTKTPFKDSSAKTNTEIKTSKPAPENSDDVVPSLATVMGDLLKSYKDTVKVDTIFMCGNDSLKIKLKHFCTFDHKINLPKGYLDVWQQDTLKKFVTHNFISYAEIKLNSRILFKGFIRKENFDKLLFKSLRQYGTLLFFNSIHFKNNMVSINYSLTIPLTDVGQSATITIDTIGHKSFTMN